MRHKNIAVCNNIALISNCMTVAETINQKIVHLPPKAQEEILEIIERIEVRYSENNNSVNKNGEDGRHVLDRIAALAMDMGVDDLAERHDYYAHGKLED